MRIAIMLVILAFIALPTAKAAPINNSTTEVPETVQTVAEVVQPTITSEAPTPIPEPVVEPERPQEAVKPQVATKKPVTGSKEEWLRLSGIPESQWGYVDYIVSKESSWNPNAVNPNGGACGLAQALPCSKLGTNWNDPVHALKWQHAYVTDRYGGYAQAYSFWIANNWY